MLANVLAGDRGVDVCPVEGCQTERCSSLRFKVADARVTGFEEEAEVRAGQIEDPGCRRCSDRHPEHGLLGVCQHSTPARRNGAGCAAGDAVGAKGVVEAGQAAAEAGQCGHEAVRAADIHVADVACAVRRSCRAEDGCGGEVERVLERRGDQPRIGCRVLIPDERPGDRGVRERCSASAAERCRQAARSLSARPWTSRAPGWRSRRTRHSQLGSPQAGCP